MLLKKVCILSVLMSALAFGENIAVNHSEKLVADEKYILKSEKNLITAMSAKNRDGSINVLIEIPSGTNGKWEVNKETGNLDWEFKEQFPGTLENLQTWFVNYKGVGEDMKVSGFAGKKEADKVLNDAIKGYKKCGK